MAQGIREAATRPATKFMPTIVNITLVQDGNKIVVRSDSLGQDEEVLALGLQILSHLSYIEHMDPDFVEVHMPTLSFGQH